MSKSIYTIETQQAPKPIGPYSQAVAAGGLLFISGQIALNPETGSVEATDVQQQTHLVMKNLLQIASVAGKSADHIVKTSIFIKDMNDFAAVNEVYGSYFQDHFPARETVEVSRLPKDVLVEISAIISLA